MPTNTHAPTPHEPPSLAAMLHNLDATQRGWESAAARERAFHELRTFAARIIQWRVSLNDPPVDAVDVWVWAVSRLDARELARETVDWPAECVGVPQSSRGDVLRAACRFQFDLWKREQKDIVDAIRECEGDTLPWSDSDDAPSSNFTPEERAAFFAAPASEKRNAFATMCLSALARLRGDRRAAA